MRRLTPLLVLLACASPGRPPGGPPDDVPPRVLKVTPDSGTASARVDGVQFLFSEVVSERPQGATDLAGMFLISPYDGEPRISWKRTRIEVAPRRGIRPNTTYVVQLLPGLTDLSNNADSSGRTVVFSTGPQIADGLLRGVVFDWTAQRVAPRAFVSAYRLPDSTRYVAFSDSLGQFAIRGLPEGRYLLEAVLDQNRNRALDTRELFDTTTVALTDSLVLELLAIVRDTIGPGIENVERPDSLTLRVEFDRGLDSAQVLTLEQFTLKAQDSSVVQVASLLRGRAYEQQRQDSIRRRAQEDSVRRAQQADSTWRADSLRAVAEGRPVGRRPGPPAAPARPAGDTTRREPPKPSVLAPERVIVLKLPQPLQPATSYRLKASDIRSFLGHTRTSERQFQTPRATAPDTSRTAPRDTVSRR